MDPLTFKFGWVDQQGRESGFFAKKGEVNEADLILDKTVIPLGGIYSVVHRYNRLGITYQADRGPVTTTVAVHGGKEQEIKQMIDRLCSYRWTENRHEQLVKDGQGAAFRTAKCRLCTAVVDLTGFADTPQFYCPYCECILNSNYEIEQHMDRYRLCDRCGFFGWPIRYRTTYFILNLIQWREHLSCHVCMRRECWKMMIGNVLPPFIGMAYAIWQTVRAYAAGTLDPRFPDLVRANALAQKKRAAEAEAVYQGMLDRTPVQAGLRYNLALANAKAGGWERCLDFAQESLDDCSNYTPAANLMMQAFQALGRPADAYRVGEFWGKVTAAPPPASLERGHDQATREQIQTRPSAGGSDIWRK